MLLARKNVLDKIAVLWKKQFVSPLLDITEILTEDQSEGLKAYLLIYWDSDYAVYVGRVAETNCVSFKQRLLGKLFIVLQYLVFW